MACEACMTIPPVVADYTPKGETITSGDLPIYVSGKAKRGYELVRATLLPTSSPHPSTPYPPTQPTAKAGASRGIVYVPDIFGVTSQAHQVRTGS